MLYLLTASVGGNSGAAQGQALRSLLVVAVIAAVIWFSRKGYFQRKGKLPPLPAGYAPKVAGTRWIGSDLAAQSAAWAGVDSVLNRVYSGGAKTLLVMGGLALAVPIFTMPLKDASFAGALSQYVGGGLLVAALILWGLNHRKWLHPSWQLIASPDGLTYSKNDGGLLTGSVHPDWLRSLPPALHKLAFGKLSTRWAVGLDQIARVESGPTVEWEKVRKYPALIAEKNGAIPEFEMQAFIFTADGRRLVVLTGNAEREDCGQLAHSIRSYVEQARAAAPVAPADRSRSAHSIRPAADGFDL